MSYCTGSTEFCTLPTMLETSLYPVVKQFLEKAGYHVKGEVNGCDAVAVRDGEPQRLAIVEMKRGFNLDLLLQAVDRMRTADEVWLAVPATSRGRDRDPRIRRLCGPIGFGLMAVHTRSKRIEVLAAPGPYRPRPDQRRRTRLLSEHARRSAIRLLVVHLGNRWPTGSRPLSVPPCYRPDQPALAIFEPLRLKLGGSCCATCIAGSSVPSVVCIG